MILAVDGPGLARVSAMEEDLVHLQVLLRCLSELRLGYFRSCTSGAELKREPRTFGEVSNSVQELWAFASDVGV